ncbi:YwmB family TATA-box binding protein [Mesobacillus zeae]|uniref:YwmB family TATA-box binding protein n=1 Tax=Mesobacillus zeae TaxID=1917180 RepID=A0A398B3P0_9BACI|nr:YwmB family TATA-box binding protein [Mesobacillus zeae]RID83458.1 hypothetical protein D1970_15660 [Mesobacillus zeae]
MKKLLLLVSFFGIIGFVMLQAGNRTTVADSGQVLPKLAEVLGDEHILINGWSIYARERMEDVQTQQDLDNLVSGLKSKLPEWTWKQEESKQQRTLTAVSDSTRHQEKLKIITTDTDGRLHTYVMYEVRGHSWNDKTETFLNTEIKNRLFDIFREKAKVFSCIKGELSDKMDTSLPIYMKRLLKSFDAEELEALKEHSFISTSAFSPLFDTSMTDEHKMNLQLGIRKTQDMGGKTTIVVGTPIITIEY